MKKQLRKRKRQLTVTSERQTRLKNIQSIVSGESCRKIGYGLQRGAVGRDHMHRGKKESRKGQKPKKNSRNEFLQVTRGGGGDTRLQQRDPPCRPNANGGGGVVQSGKKRLEATKEGGL